MFNNGMERHFSHLFPSISQNAFGQFHGIKTKTKKGHS
jgi:hypothetical protein